MTATQTDAFAQHPKTLEEARDELRDNLREGTTCPCCDQVARMYRRPIYASMAVLLIWLARNRREGEWCPVSEMPEIQSRRGGGDFGKLIYWGLIEERPPDADTKARTSGQWRITSRGKMYAAGFFELPKYVLIYNGACLGFEGEPRGVRECLGKRFDFAELWRDA